MDMDQCQWSQKVGEKTLGGFPVVRRPPSTQGSFKNLHYYDCSVAWHDSPHPQCFPVWGSNVDIVDIVSPFICLHHGPRSQSGSSEQIGKVLKYLGLFGGHRNVSQSVSLLLTAGFFAECQEGGKSLVFPRSQEVISHFTPTCMFEIVPVIFSCTDMWETD